MIVQRLILTNWRNFLQLDVQLRDVTYIIGANATGKSNLMDVFRFLRDICKPGGLRKAVEDRGVSQSFAACMLVERPQSALRSI